MHFSELVISHGLRFEVRKSVFSSIENYALGNRKQDYAGILIHIDK